MAENKMKEVAKLLGVELEEEFKIEGFRCKYKLTKDGLMYWSYLESKWLIENQYVSFPYFKKGTMYKGMEEYKKYTLEELGL